MPGISERHSLFNPSFHATILSTCATLLAIFSSIEGVISKLPSFIEIIRNTPLIVQLFFITFGLPSLFGYIWPFWLHALLALVIHYSGYFAAIMYTGFLTISKSQVEAAKSLGIKNYILFTKILLPQVI